MTARTVLAGSALAVVLTGAVTPAPAAPPRRDACIALVQRAASVAVSRRDATVGALSARLAARPAVTAAHRATLSEFFTTDRSGLQATLARVMADTTCATVRADARRIVTDYRVYVLLVPQAHLTVASDAGLAGAARLAAAEPAAAAAVAALPAGSAKTKAQAAYADLVSSVTSARRHLTGVGDRVLALRPSGYPGTTTTLDAARADVTAGARALRQAVAAARSLAALL